MDWYLMNLLTLALFFGSMVFVVFIVKTADRIGAWIVSHKTREGL